MSTVEKVLENTTLERSSLLDEVMAQTRITPNEEGYDIAKKGIAAFIENLVSANRTEEPVNKSLVDQMLVELDKKISSQMDEILHNETFQQMESSWKGLKLLVDRTDFSENNKSDLLHATKEELLEILNFRRKLLSLDCTNMFTLQVMASLAESQQVR